MLQIHLVFYQFNDRHQQISVSQPTKHVLKNTQVFVFHTCCNAMRKRSQHHQRNMGILVFNAAGNLKRITVISTRHTDDKIECSIRQLLPSLLFGRYLCKTRRITKAEVHVFIKYLFIDSSVIFQHKSIIRISNQKDIEYSFSHKVYERSILEIQLI